MRQRVRDNLPKKEDQVLTAAKTLTSRTRASKTISELFNTAAKIIKIMAEVAV